MSWLQVKLEVPGSVADELSDVCVELGAVSASLDNAGPDKLVESVLEPGPGETIVWQRAVITAFWEATGPFQDALAALQQKIQDTGVFAEVSCEFVAEDQLAGTSPQVVEELSFADGRFWLVPRSCSAERLAELAETACLRLDPGLAFGSGLHPTTQLCLDALARVETLNDAVVLDFGCGSGVLGLAALALGARSADGVDHDPQALVATQDNAAYNDLAAGIRVFMPEQLPSQARYEVVVANILANPLIELAPQITGRLKPGATLLLAGLLAHQADAVQQAYPDISFQTPVAYSGDPSAPRGELLNGLADAADERWVLLHGELTG